MDSATAGPCIPTTGRGFPEICLERPLVSWIQFHNLVCLRFLELYRVCHDVLQLINAEIIWPQAPIWDVPPASSTASCNNILWRIATQILSSPVTFVALIILHYHFPLLVPTSLVEKTARVVVVVVVLGVTIKCNSVIHCFLHNIWPRFCLPNASNSSHSSPLTLINSTITTSG